MNKLKYNCIFGGGAIRGLCYIGALRALRELNIEIGIIAGSSVGAVFASLLAAGYDENEIEQLFMDFNFNVFRDINLGFSPDFSFSKGKVFLNWLREKISYKVSGEKASDSPVLFKDLKKELYVVTTDLLKNKPFVFSKSATPDAEVAFAVRASAGMPGLLKPVNYNDMILIDGDFSKSMPVWKTDKNMLSDGYRILEFRLEGSSNPDNIKNPLDYFNTIYNAFSYLATSNVIEKYGRKDKFDYVVFDTKDLLLIDFALSQKERTKLIEQGYEDTIKYFKTVLLKKKIAMIPLYKSFYEQILELKSCINSNKYLISINKINSILASSHFKLEITDTAFHTKLFELKEIIEKSRKKRLFASDELKEKEKILIFTEKIVNQLNCHLRELNDFVSNYGNNH